MTAVVILLTNQILIELTEIGSVDLTYTDTDVSFQTRKSNYKVPVKATTSTIRNKHSNLTNMNKLVHDWINPENNIVNPHDFKYIINEPNFCEGGVDIIIFVHSAVFKTISRQLIRETWGNVSEYQNWKIKTVFMLGKSHKVPQKKILEESKKHHDIIQEDFIDHYRNLTHKQIMGIKWIKEFCETSKYIVKVDEDLIVNVFKLVEYVKEIEKLKKQYSRTIFCSVFSNERPRRYLGDKWFVTKEEYPFGRYPAYCEGYAYIMRKDLIVPLYEASLRLKYYWIDDVYVTGMLVDRINATRQYFIKGYSSQRVGIPRFTKVGDKALFILMDNKVVANHWHKHWHSIKTKT